MIYLFLAEGFEEIEAISAIDIIRRAELPLCTVGIGSRAIMGAHGIAIAADMTDAELSDLADMSGIVLPGGMPGTLNLEKSETVQKCIDFAAEKGLMIAAICAAPSILGKKGLLNGKKAVCFDGFEDFLLGAVPIDDFVCIDQNYITARGAGVAVDFALEIVKFFSGEQRAALLRKALKCRS